jgi:peptide/nickel transport system permease protein
MLMVPVVLFVGVAIFTIMYFSSGDPAQIILGVGASKEEIFLLREKMNLDDPFIVQLGRFMYDTFIRFDLGTSYMNGKPIIDEVVTRLSKTLVFAMSAIVIEFVVGIPLGMAAATHRNGLMDQLCMFLALIGVSAPAFWIGLQLMLIFSLRLGWFPAYGVETWKGWVLPIFVNSLRGVAEMTRQSRSSLLEVIRSDYVVMARAKGLTERKILFGYALPNALIPLIQIAGLSFGMSLGGTVIIENVFSIPGIGQYLVNAISNRDYAVIRSSVVVLSVAFSIVMLLVDLAFGFVDPRIKAQYEGSGKTSKWQRRRSVHAQ